MMVVMVMMVAIARINVIIVVARVGIRIPVAWDVIRVVSGKTIGIVFVIMVSIINIVPAPMRRFDNRVAVCRNFGAVRRGGDRRGRGGHCPEGQRQTTAGCTEPMLQFHGSSSLFLATPMRQAIPCDVAEQWSDAWRGSNGELAQTLRFWPRAPKLHHAAPRPALCAWRKTPACLFG